MSRFYYSSDYAGTRFGNVTFYYGYERIDANGDWAFVYQVKGEPEGVYTFKQLGERNMFDVVECLMAGIELFFDGVK